MRAKTIKYFFEEGIKGFFANGLMSLASVFIVVASLLILGIYLIFSLNINYIGEQFESQYEIRAFIDFDTSYSRIENIVKEIKNINGVSDIKLVTADEALKDYREELGDDAFILDGLGNDNPLRDSLKITMTDLNAADYITAKVSSMNNIARVNNSKDVMTSLLQITSTIRHASFVLMILLSIVAIFIISNAIRMTVFARRRDIGIAKFLGATDWFIRWPFIVEGVIMGIVGSIIALILVIPTYSYIFGALTAFAGNSMKFLTTGIVMKEISLWLVGIGALLGAFGSGISLGRYLKV